MWDNIRLELLGFWLPFGAVIVLGVMESCYAVIAFLWLLNNMALIYWSNYFTGKKT